MKKKVLNFSPFKTYEGYGLVFIKPHPSKVFRLYEIPDTYRIPEVIFKLMDHGAVRRGDLYIFPISEEYMSGLCLELSTMGVQTIYLETDTDLLN